MPVPPSIARICGPPHETGAFEPIALNDAARVVVVARGYLDLFVVETERENPLRRNPFIARVGEGHAAFGGPELAASESGQRNQILLAVPSRNALVMESERSRFLAEGALDIHAVVLVDEWVSSLSELLTRNGYLPPRDIQLLEADPDVPYAAGSVVSAHHADVVWVSADQPMRFIGDEQFRIEAESLLPLSERTWLGLDVDTRITARHTPALLGSEQLWPALDRFHTLALRIGRGVFERNVRTTVEAHEANRRDQDAIRATISRDIGSVLLDPETRRFSAAGVGRTALHAAVKVVAESAGGVLTDSRAHDDKRGGGDFAGSLVMLARLSGLRTREITLEDGWFKQDGPSFVGRAVDGRPLALLATGRGGYRAIDPSEGRDYPVDREVAGKIEPIGFMLYVPLPTRIRSGLAALRHVVSRFGRDFRLLITMAVLSGLIALLTPILTGELLSEIIPRGDEAMWIAALGALALGALGAAVFDVVGALAALRIEGRTDEQLQASVWGRLVSLPISFFRRFTAGDLADRANGVGMIRQMLTGATVHGLVTGVFSIFSLALLFWYSWTLALCALGISLLLAAGSALLVRVQVRHYRDGFRASGLVDGFVFQMITGIRKIRMANAENYALAQWARRFSEQRRALLAARYWGAGQHTVNSMFQPLSLLLLFAFIWYALLEGEDQPSFDLGDFLSFNAAFGQFAASVVALTGSFTTISSTIPLFERVKPILECPPESSTGIFVPPDLTGDIEFTKVVFRYLPDAANALTDVSFRIRQGEYVAFVGPSGSGKSTIYRLLLGFERPDSGAVLIDGHDLLHLDLPTVRNLMGVVLQDGKLTAASIYENIAGSSPLGMKEAWDAARAAGLEDDIRAMPMGMHTVLPEGGVGLSGGQKQRVLIARALARRPRIMLFDEATSALDNRTQLTVQESLRKFSITRIVIAHRLSTIRDADRIFVMKEGRIVDVGRYDELMARDGVFADLARRQVV